MRHCIFNIAVISLIITLNSSCTKKINAVTSAPARALFLGSWQVYNKSSNTNAAQYVFSINALDSNDTSVAIANLHNYFTAALNGYVLTDSLYIPYQVSSGYSIQGVAYFIPVAPQPELVIHYTLTNLSTSTVTNYADSCGE